MKNIILCYVKNSDLSNLKNFSSKDFFDSWKKDKEKDYFGVRFSKPLSNDEVHNIFLNDKGFVYLNPHEQGVFFELFRQGIPSSQIISQMMRKPLSDFETTQGDDGIHLLAFYESDVPVLENDEELFRKITAFIRKNKSENKIIEGDSISARILKETQSPLTYLAYLPKTKGLWLDVSNDLITFFGYKNLNIS